MKLKQSGKEKVLQRIYRALLILAAVMILLLIIGTIIGLARPSGSKPLFSTGKTRVTEQNAAAGDDGTNIFTGIGRLRIPLVNSSTLILSVAFPYPVADITFSEELAGKIGEFRNIAIAYFSALPPEKIIVIDEDTAKTEILRRYNAALRLGRIEALYFSDLITIDGSQ